MDDRDSTERPSLRKTRCVGGDWSRWAATGPHGALQTQSRAVFAPLHSTALTNTLLLFLLFYECRGAEERDRADFPDSDNISNQASKSHLTNPPAGQQKAAGPHSLSHSNRVHVRLCHASSALNEGRAVESKILNLVLFAKSIPVATICRARGEDVQEKDF